MADYRLTQNHRRGGETFEAGEEYDPTEAELDAFPHLFETVDDDGEDEDGAATADGGEVVEDDPVVETTDEPPDDGDDTVADDTATADAESEDEDICGAEMADGSVCQRKPEKCPYDSHRSDE